MDATRLFSSRVRLRLRFARQRSATVAIMTALALPILLGATGFVLDAGLWYSQQTTLQAATDAAAMQAARDLNENAATSPTTLESDAVAAANAASASQFNLTSTSLTTTQLTDKRQVEVDASIPGLVFFSQIPEEFSAHVTKLPKTVLRATSVAGVSYSLISSQATCYAFDSYNYLYSTGIGTIDTAHSSGIDPYSCGSTPPSPPSAYDAYCDSGITGALVGCTVQPILNSLNVNIGDVLPFAFQISPGNMTGLNLVLNNVAVTLGTLLTTEGTSNSGPTLYTVGTCGGPTCTIPAGVYNGGITIGPGVTTVNFAASGGSNLFIIENGDLIVPSQATLGVSNDANAVFYMTGTTPGAFITETQVLFNAAPITNGTMAMTSTSTFTSNSLAGAQTSAPISSMGYAQIAASSSPGVLSLLGLPGGNLAGTNFESLISVCPQAASTCANPIYVCPTTSPCTNPIFQSSIVPSLTVLNGDLGGLLSGTALLDVSLSEVSTTTITSTLTIANGVATNWQQTESATSTLKPPPVLTNLLSSLGLLSTILNNLLDLGIMNSTQTLLNKITVDNGGPLTETLTQSGIFTGQTSTTAPTTCTNFYTNTIDPELDATYSNILNSSTTNVTNGGNTSTDTINICGTSPVANLTLTPISPTQTIVASSAAGASTLTLLR
jgi:Flp pilus assembly protein TadG